MDVFLARALAVLRNLHVRADNYTPMFELASFRECACTTVVEEAHRDMRRKKQQHFTIREFLINDMRDRLD